MLGFGSRSHAIAKACAEQPARVQAIVESARNEVSNNRGILSMSARNDSILMWSHYSAQHTGLVLGFDVLADETFFTSTLPVEYREEYTPLNYIKDPQSALRTNFSLKSISWAYEVEVRVIKIVGGAKRFKPLALTDVYIGCKSEPGFVEKVRTQCATTLPHVRLHQASLVHGRFELKFDRL